MLSALGLVSVAELGDKSMFAVIALATRYGRKGVFVGALSALIIVSVIGALLGTTASILIDENIIQPFAALVFLAFGTYMLLKKDPAEDEDEVYKVRSDSGVLASFSLIAVMEMGDKTQIAIFALAASTGDLISVVLGAAIAFTVLVAIEVYLGDKIGKRISAKKMRMVAGLVFLAFGVAYLLQWLL